MSKGIFVIGTGTDIGKTYVTGLILKKLKELGKNACYYKAAMSGNDRREDGSLIPGDALWVKTASGIDQSLESMCPYIYENAYSPHLASRIEGNPVELSVVLEQYEKLKAQYEYVTVEGSGGIMCPICFDESKIGLVDVINSMELDCLLIADAGLGTINNVCLTYEYMKQKGMKIKGVIFNNYIPGDVMHDDNIFMCEYMTGLKTLGTVTKDQQDLQIDAEALLSIYS